MAAAGCWCGFYVGAPARKHPGGRVHPGQNRCWGGLDAAAPARYVPDRFSIGLGNGLLMAGFWLEAASIKVLDAQQTIPPGPPPRVFPWAWWQRPLLLGSCPPGCCRNPGLRIAATSTVAAGCFALSASRLFLRRLPALAPAPFPGRGLRGTHPGHARCARSWPSPARLQPSSAPRRCTERCSPCSTA